MTTTEQAPDTGEPTPEVVAEVLTGTLESAADQEERKKIVEELNENLTGHGVAIVDFTIEPGARRGVRTGRTREEVLDAMAINTFRKGLRKSGTARRIGRTAI